MSDQIAVSGKARKFGIPSATVGWGTSYTQFTATIFTEVQKTMGADIDPTMDNDGERQGQNRRNKTIQLRFSAQPIGTAISDAQAICAALPNKGDLIKITCASDSQVACDLTADTAIVDDASVRYTPEGAAVLDFTITKWIGKLFVAIS